MDIFYPMSYERKPMQRSKALDTERDEENSGSQKLSKPQFQSFCNHDEVMHLDCLSHTSLFIIVYSPSTISTLTNPNNPNECYAPCGKSLASHSS
jgi:hypothetical protein